MVSKYRATISGTSNILEFLYIVIKVNKLVTLSRFLTVFIIFQFCVHVWVFTCQCSCLRLPEVLDSREVNYKWLRAIQCRWSARN